MLTKLLELLKQGEGCSVGTLAEKLAVLYRGKFMLSVILAVFGVAAGLLPFFAVSRIVVLLMEKETSVSVYMEWCLAAGLGFLAKVCLSNLSTLISHTATFATLVEIRHNMLQQILLYRTSIIVIAEGLCFYLNRTMELSARFFDVDGGKITIGGTDIRDYTLDSLLAGISEVFQKVYLFADTIENNIRFGNPQASHEEVMEAAKKACCHDFIMSLTDGYNTVIGEGGGSLSGGEKQRISIARAILKDAPVIILDEATSSVDPENENLLMKAIAELTKDKTVIMIAHRLKTVRNADQIFVLSDSHIVQRGTHDELIRQPGIYADFIGVRRKAIGWKLKQT